MVLKRINGPGHTSIAPVVRLFHQDAPTLIEFALFCGENIVPWVFKCSAKPVHKIPGLRSTHFPFTNIYCQLDVYESL
jgi:hypothetical protein